MKVLQTFGNYNPSGIVINDGWIALAACVYGDLTVEGALYKICGMHFGGDRRSKPGQGKTKDILQLYREEQELTNIQIAQRIGCSREMVRYVLKKAGLPARTRRKEA